LEGQGVEINHLRLQRILPQKGRSCYGIGRARIGVFWRACRANREGKFIVLSAIKAPATFDFGG
jgi:hypothetical protein